MSVPVPNEIVFVDHSAQLGGGQLALLRYLEWQGRQLRARLILFEEGPLADCARALGNVQVCVLRAKNPLMRIWELNRVLSASKGSIVANSLSALSNLALLPTARTRLIYYLRQEAVPDEAPLLKRLYLARIALPGCRAFLANSDWTARTLPALPGTSRPAVVYTVSGVRDADVGMAKPEPTPDVQADPLRVLSLSRLSPWKGIDVIIDAVTRVNARAGATVATLTVAGGNLFHEDDYSKRLRLLADRASGAIAFVGHVDDVQGLIDSHDTLVSASITPEPFGQVLIQGLSRGCLTIGTAQGGAAEIISDRETGLLVPPNDADALADALMWVIAHPERSRSIRQAGMERCRMFTDERTLPLLERALAAELPHRS